MSNFKNKYNDFKEKYKERCEEYRRIELEKYNKYINHNYVQINSTNELRNILTMKKDDMYCINDKYIYIYTGKEYYWERYKVNHKKERLDQITNTDDGAYRGYYEYSPTNKFCKELKEKKMEGWKLTDEEEKAIIHRSFSNMSLIFHLLLIATILLLGIFFK